MLMLQPKKEKFKDLVKSLRVKSKGQVKSFNTKKKKMNYYLIFLTGILFFSSVFSLNVTCGTYKIGIIPTSDCLSNEFSIYVNNFFLACMVNDDSYSRRTTEIIKTLCNENNAKFLSNYPNQIITCNHHKIEIKATNNCLSNELNILIDNVNFNCIRNDDNYSTEIIYVIGAMCDKNGSNITITN